MAVEKPVDNVEKCVSIIINSFLPQSPQNTKPGKTGCITGEK